MSKFPIGDMFLKAQILKMEEKNCLIIIIDQNEFLTCKHARRVRLTILSATINYVKSLQTKLRRCLVSFHFQESKFFEKGY